MNNIVIRNTGTYKIKNKSKIGTGSVGGTETGIA
jgi:hypothetical protein